MIGNDLLLDRMMREHRERLLREGSERRRAAQATGERSPGSVLRTVAGRSGDALVAFGRRLQALDPHTPRGRLAPGRPAR